MRNTDTSAARARITAGVAVTRGSRRWACDLPLEDAIARLSEGLPDDDTTATLVTITLADGATHTIRAEPEESTASAIRRWYVALTGGDDHVGRVATFVDYLFEEMLKQWDTENS